MQTIKTFATIIEAEVLKTALEAAGIPAHIVGSGMRMEGGISGVLLQVPDDRVDEALMILQGS